MIYLAHCSYHLDEIISQKIIKTSRSLGIDKKTGARTDVVYFTFLFPDDPEQIYRYPECVAFVIKDLLKKYRYYAMSIIDSYGNIFDLPDFRLSSRLYKLVQLSNDIDDLKNNIINDKRMSNQCKNTLLQSQRLDELFQFKNKPNPSIQDIINTDRSNWTEIIFFEDIDFKDIPFKIFRKNFD